MTQDHSEVSPIRYVTQDLFGRRELWAVWTARPRTGFGEPRYRALFAVAVASDEGARPITRCELGQTPLNAKRPIDRATAAALHPALVQRAEAEQSGQHSTTRAARTTPPATQAVRAATARPCSTNWTGSTPRWTSPRSMRC